MIIYLVFLHALIQRVFSSDPAQFELVVNSIPLWADLALSPLVLISLWGTVFSFLTGVSVAYTMGSKTKKDKKNLNSAFRNRIIASVLLYLVFLIYKFIFGSRCNSNPESSYSLLTGSLELGTFHLPNMIHMITSDTLESLALWGIILSVFFYILWKKDGFTAKNAKKTMWWLIGLGFAILIGSYFIRELVGDPRVVQTQLLNEHRYVEYFFFLRFYAERFAIFPVMSFALFGAGLGILLAQGVSFKKIRNYGLSIASILLAAFGVEMYLGFDIIGAFANEMVLLPMQFLNLGLQMITLIVLLRIIDFRKKPISKQGQKIIAFFGRYSALSLTVYTLEPLTSQLVYMLFSNLYGGPFFMDFPMILLYLQTEVFLWVIITKLWAKVRYIGSFEWLIGKGRKFINSKHYLVKNFGIWIQNITKNLIISPIKNLISAEKI